MFQIDFLVSKYNNNNVCSEYRNVIENHCGKIILKQNISNKSIVKELKNIKQFFQKNHYDIVHSHIINMGYFYLKYAKKNGVRVRILHSHSTMLWSKNILLAFRNKVFTQLALKNANTYFACSHLAGKFLFHNKKYYLIKNAIELDKYAFDSQIRNQYRNDLKIENCILYGHVGRYNVQKNHMFLLQIFFEIHKEQPNSKLLLVGKGELEDQILSKIRQLNLQNDVILLGERSDVFHLFQAMDVFLLPSLFEGLPMVGVEAQASGLVCYFSNEITEEVKVLDTTRFLPIDDAVRWKKEILANILKRNDRTSAGEKMILAGYDIKTEVKYLESLYKDFYEKVKK